MSKTSLTTYFDGYKMSSAQTKVIWICGLVYAFELLDMTIFSFVSPVLTGRFGLTVDDLATLNMILDKVLPYVSTSLDVDEMVAVLGEVNNYNIVAKDGFPFEEYRSTGNLGSKGSCVIPVDLKANVTKLHSFLFESEEYVMSEEVQEYSQRISTDTGR